MTDYKMAIYLLKMAGAISLSYGACDDLDIKFVITCNNPWGSGEIEMTFDENQNMV